MTANLRFKVEVQWLHCGEEFLFPTESGVWGWTICESSAWKWYVRSYSVWVYDVLQEASRNEIQIEDTRSLSRSPNAWMDIGGCLFVELFKLSYFSRNLRSLRKKCRTCYDNVWMKSVRAPDHHFRLLPRYQPLPIGRSVGAHSLCMLPRPTESRHQPAMARIIILGRQAV